MAKFMKERRTGSATAYICFHLRATRLIRAKSLAWFEARTKTGLSKDNRYYPPASPISSAEENRVLEDLLFITNLIPYRGKLSTPLSVQA